MAHANTPSALRDDRVTAHRAESFISLGFEEEQLPALIGARGDDGYGLSLAEITKHLELGATHDQIIRIFT